MLRIAVRLDPALLERGELLVEAGATGIRVPHHPVLLDLLRNPDEEDDRGDLLIATS